MRQITGNHKVYGELAYVDNIRANAIFDNNYAGSFRDEVGRECISFGKHEKTLEEIDLALERVDIQILRSRSDVKEAQEVVDDYRDDNEGNEDKLADAEEELEYEEHLLGVLIEERDELDEELEEKTIDPFTVRA